MGGYLLLLSIGLGLAACHDISQGFKGPCGAGICSGFDEESNVPMCYMPPDAGLGWICKQAPANAPSAPPRFLCFCSGDCKSSGDCTDPAFPECHLKPVDGGTFGVCVCPGFPSCTS